MAIDSKLREFQNAVLARKVAQRFAASRWDAPEVKKAVADFIERSKLGLDLVTGMMNAVKAAGLRFGMRDAKKAIAAFVEGDEPTDPVLVAAWTHLKSPKGQKQLQTLIDGVHAVLKKETSHVGFRDVGQAIVAWFAE